MGKKSSLSLDLGYDSWTDDYHEGDEYIDIGCENTGTETASAITRQDERLLMSMNQCMIDGTTKSARQSSFVKDNSTTSQRSLTVVKPTSKVIYVHNPLRQPLFTDHITSSNDLLIHVASHLALIDVLNLSMVSKQLQKGLANDGLYCSHRNLQNQEGILLPALKHVADRLLPLDMNRVRPRGISQLFACECLAFRNAANENERNSFEPKKILSMTSPEQINAISCNQVRWKQPHAAFAGKGYAAPKKTYSWRSGVRLSYVTNEPNNCALMTVWGGDHFASFLPQSSVVASQHISQERYLPPNTKHVIEAAIYSDSNLCAILAQPLEDGSQSHYVLSLVALPTSPPGTAKGKNDGPDKYKLLWQRHVSWDLFSSSETHPIVEFSSQGKYIIFGSTERFGVVGIETGSCILDPMKGSRSTISAYYLHHEFLFILDNGGTRIRVYDVSNPSSGEVVAEGAVPWSVILPKNHKQATGLVRLYHTHEQQRQQMRNEYELAFCGGRLWITGFFHRDLICTAPRLLRRFRSQLSSSTGNMVALPFTRVKNDLQLSSPKKLHVWNETHLYVADSTKLHCWRTDTNHSRDHTVDTLLSANDYIESVSCAGTKLIVANNCTFRNTNTREWDGSGTITVIPIDSYEPTNAMSHTDFQPTPPPRRSNRPILNLMHPRPYSPMLQVYNKSFFRHHTFTGRINVLNGHGSSLQTHHHPISSSTGSNYRIIDICSDDGRYLVVRCKKGNANKIAVFDLYSCCERDY